MKYKFLCFTHGVSDSITVITQATNETKAKQNALALSGRTKANLQSIEDLRGTSIAKIKGKK